MLKVGGRSPRYRDGAAVHPLDPPRASASGPAPYRIQLVGAELLAGRGVTTHDLALSGCLARSLGGALGHGVDVEGRILRGTGIAQYDLALRSGSLAHVDALVLLLDDDRAVRWSGGLRRLLNGLAARLAESAVLMVVVPSGTATPGGGDLVAAVRAAAHRVAEVVELGPQPAGPHQPVERYAAWAEDIAFPLVTRLKAPRLWDEVDEHIDERARRRDVQAAGDLTPAVELSLQRIVNFASAGYRTTAAAISLIDGSTTKYIVARHLAYREQVRDSSLCATTLQQFGGLIVADARLDERFKDFDIVRNGGVRFYAGHRIVSPNGLPIGALCVFDSTPRIVGEEDLVLLRDFALAAERLLWQAWPNASASQALDLPATSIGARPVLGSRR